MSFVTSIDCPPRLPAPDTLITGDWFPDIDPAQVRAAHRIREGALRCACAPH